MTLALDRRRFLTLCGVAAGTVCFGPAARALSALAGGKTLMIDDLSKALFEQYVGEPFTARAEGQEPVALTLSRVVEAPARLQEARGGAPALESFAVLFDGAASAVLPQGMCTLEHPRMGSVTLFMVPVVSGSESVRRYEVVINRLLKS